MSHNINRREFLRRIGIGSVAATGLVMTGCSSRKETLATEGTESGPIPTDKMTYRTNPKTGEKVSLLGYGCMRWPTKPGKDKDGNPEEELDQEAINSLVDEAIAHGVNYFDTSPAYCR